MTLQDDFKEADDAYMWLATKERTSPEQKRRMSKLFTRRAELLVKIDLEDGADTESALDMSKALFGSGK